MSKNQIKLPTITWENAINALERNLDEEENAKTNEQKAKNAAEKKERNERERKFREEQAAENARLNQEANAQIQRNIDCKNRYKNNSGKLQLPPQFKDLPDSQIYFYHGHGGTICDEYGFPIEKIVPENCIYITETVCGIINALGPALIGAFLDEKNAPIWKDPVGHFDELKKIFRLDGRNSVQGLHIHLPGCTYIDTTYQPIGYHDLKERHGIDKHKIVFSGIMTLEAAHTVPHNSAYIEGALLDYTDLVDYETIVNSYAYSLYPEIHEVSEYVTPNEIEDTLLLYPEKVGEKNKISISDVTSQAAEISKNVPVSKLMEKFPGIHFNMLCRSFGAEDVNCLKRSKKAVTRRRRHSAVVQNTVYDSFKKLVNMGTRFPTKAKRVANDNSILDYFESVSRNIRQNPDLVKIYELYDYIRYLDELTKTRTAIGDLFKELFQNKFLELYFKFLDTKNQNEKESIKREIYDLIGILKTDVYIAFTSPRHEFENELLAQIAWAAAHGNDTDLFDHICGIGNLQDLENQEFQPNVKKGEWINRCAGIYKEALDNYVFPNNNSNRGSQNGGNRKRKTLKKKRT